MVIHSRLREDTRAHLQTPESKKTLVNARTLYPSRAGKSATLRAGPQPMRHPATPQGVQESPESRQSAALQQSVALVADAAVRAEGCWGWAASSAVD